MAQLLELDQRLREDEITSKAEWAQLDRITVGDPMDGTPGSATHMENDLGSYTPAAIQGARGVRLVDKDPQVGFCYVTR